MNLKYLPVRLELSFWNFVINLLSESRGIRSLVAWIFSDHSSRLKAFIRTFQRNRALGWATSSLILFFLLGLGLYSPTQSLATTGSAPATGQHNLLVIGVDDLTSQSPLLESVWLVGHFPGNSVFILVPLYPIENDDSQNKDLANTFTLNHAGEPDRAFFNLLGRKTWWNNYLVIDEAGIAATLDFLGEITPKGSLLDGSGTFKSPTRPIIEQFATPQGQSELLQLACIQAASIHHEQLIQGLNRIKPHIKSNLDLTPPTRDWFTEKGSPPGLRCEFPVTDPNEP